MTGYTISQVEQVIYLQFLRLTNSVKDKLRKGESVIGPVISVNNVEVAARAATLGFDFIWLEMEHCPLSLETVRNIVLATRGLPAVPLARPPTNELWTAKRLLDAGVLGVIFPFTRTPELARQAGFVQVTYGSFKGAMCFDDCPSNQYNDQFRDLWASQPQRKMDFRYGYVDAKRSNHLLVTRRAPVATP